MRKGMVIKIKLILLAAICLGGAGFPALANLFDWTFGGIWMLLFHSPVATIPIS